MDHWTENYCQEDNVNKTCNVIKKETLAQVFSYEFCEISKNNFSKNTSGGCFCILSKAF